MYPELSLIVTSETATATLELLTTTMFKRTLKNILDMFEFFGSNKKKYYGRKFYLLFVETESVISGESLVTNIALVWLHTGVQLDVLFQIVISKKLGQF